MSVPAILRILTRSLAALGLLLAVVTLIPGLLLAWTHVLSGPYRDPVGDVLVVLGADQLDTHSIGVTSYWRATYAALVWRGGSFHRMLICGGPPQAPVSQLMKDFVVAEGVPAAAVETETGSDSTRENALAAARILKDAPGVKVLLSSDYHMYRASRGFAKAGLKVTPAYFPDAGKRLLHWRDRWAVFLDLCQETAKIAWYRLHGWI